MSDEAKVSLSNGVQILNKYESDETKPLTNEQLQRLVLLKQVKVLSLQQKRLERLDSQDETLKDVVFDFVGFDGALVLKGHPQGRGVHNT